MHPECFDVGSMVIKAGVSSWTPQTATTYLSIPRSRGNWNYPRRTLHLPASPCISLPNASQWFNVRKMLAKYFRAPSLGSRRGYKSVWQGLKIITRSAFSLALREGVLGGGVKENLRGKGDEWVLVAVLFGTCHLAGTPPFQTPLSCGLSPACGQHFTPVLSLRTLRPQPSQDSQGQTCSRSHSLLGRKWFGRERRKRN